MNAFTVNSLTAYPAATSLSVGVAEEEQDPRDNAWADTDTSEALEPEATQDATTLSLTTFIQDFGEDLMQAVARQNPPVYDGTTNPVWEALLNQLKRPPFPAQQERVQAVCKLLVQGEKAAIINGEMGSGKTLMAIAAATLLFTEGYRRTLVISPPHLVYKWRREILETVADAKVWVLNGPDTLRQLLTLRETAAQQPQVPEFYILGRVRMRMGFDWAPVVQTCQVHVRQALTESGKSDDADGTPDEKARSRVFTFAYAACPDCGELLKDEMKQLMSVARFKEASSDRRQRCSHCGAALWTLVRPTAQLNPEQIVQNALCQIPTIGPKTAGKLLGEFGADVLGSMLGDNVFEFINLMDDQGDLIFSDRQAKRMESALAKKEFSFGQGGYQASEFIKRYLPAQFFDLLVVDEGHEYKNAGSAQGQAMGVLAAKVRKVLLLTGTLMGGYAEDIFYLLWRLLPQRMLEDGYRYTASGSLSPAALCFMRQHGVLKEIYKETREGHHRTARGTRLTVHTSKAPGFGPKGVAQYVLPFTAFLKLKHIGGQVLPAYEEVVVNIPMTAVQTEVYVQLRDVLKTSLNKALRCGDKTLLGLVLSVLLAWPDTCFREEVVKHPRTRELLAYAPIVLTDEMWSPKEAECLRLCAEQKALGRKVLVYTVYTGKRDTTVRLKSLLQQQGFKVAVLRASVPTDSREEWIMDQVDRGIDVLVCNPELVKTGLDLLDFPTICFLQTGYNVYTVQQASRRSWRIGQQQDVTVYYLGYANTAQTACLSLMGQKIAVSQSTSGELPETGLDVFNVEGDSIEVALAKQLLGKEDSIRTASPSTAVPAKAHPEPADQVHVTNVDTAIRSEPQRLSSEALEGNLHQFIGTEHWYRHSLNRQMLYTDGVQFFAEHGGQYGAYWLLDIIATEIWELQKKVPFLVIKINVTPPTAKIEVSNGNDKVVWTRELDFTDLQEGTWTLYLTDNVVLLPSEY